MNIDTIDTLVLDWIIRSGYQATFNKLPASTCDYAQKSSKSLAFRAEVIGLIKKGMIIEVIEFIQQQQGGNESLNEVMFLLKLQHFIELIRQKNTTAALAWIQNNVMPSVTPTLEPILQDYLGILAYSEPETSPLAFYFEKKERYTNLAHLVNESLLDDKKSVAPIEVLVKQAVAVDDLVYELKGFGNEMDERKWSAIQHLLNHQKEKGKEKGTVHHFKTIKQD